MGKTAFNKLQNTKKFFHSKDSVIKMQSKAMAVQLHRSPFACSALRANPNGYLSAVNSKLTMFVYCRPSLEPTFLRTHGSCNKFSVQLQAGSMPAVRSVWFFQVPNVPTSKKVWLWKSECYIALGAGSSPARCYGRHSVMWQKSIDAVAVF